MFEKVFGKVIMYTVYTCLTLMLVGGTACTVKKTVDSFKGKGEA